MGIRDDVKDEANDNPTNNCNVNANPTGPLIFHPSLSLFFNDMFCNDRKPRKRAT